MLTIKWLLCAACLCGASVFAKAAIMQDEGILGSAPVPIGLATVPQDLQPQPYFGPPEELPNPYERDSPHPLSTPDSEENRAIGLRPPTDVDYSIPMQGQPFSQAPVLPNSEATSGLFPRRGTASPLTSENFPGLPNGWNVEGFRPRRITRNVVETVMEPIPEEELKEQKQLQNALKQLKVADNPAAQKEAIDTIDKNLTAQFERDLKRREQELAEVEKRVTSLREQLEKRKQAQAEIVRLKLQTLVNSANGLGFPGEESALSAPAEVSRPVYYRAATPRQFDHSSDSYIGPGTGAPGTGGPGTGGPGTGGPGTGGPGMRGPGMRGMNNKSELGGFDNFDNWDRPMAAPPGDSGLADELLDP